MSNIFLSQTIRRLTPQPLVAMATVTVASLATVITYLARPPLGIQGGQILAPVLLFAAVILAEQFPVHVRVNTKVQLTTIPIFLMAVILSPAIAATVAGLSMLIGEISVNRHKGNYASDIATDAGRWMLCALLGSLVAHLSVHPSGVPVSFGLAGAAMWLCDMLTSPATLSPMSGEKPLRVVRDMVREAGPAEGAQYVIGVMAAALVFHAVWAAPLLLLPAAMVQLTTKRSKELNRGTRAMLEGMADTVDLRDPYTGGHSRRVTELVESILVQLAKTGPEVDLITTAARLHDIGKIAVPDHILNKDGRLTDEEWAVMASHPEVGADFLGKHPGFRRGVDIVRHHHESWDGTGYPHKLAGTVIPLGSRIIAVADSYDAMTSDRPYRSGMPHAKAIAILRDGRGTQWDPQIVDAFVSVMTRENPDEALVGAVTAEKSDDARLRLVHTDGASLSQSA